MVINKENWWFTGKTGDLTGKTCDLTRRTSDKIMISQTQIKILSNRNDRNDEFTGKIMGLFSAIRVTKQQSNGELQAT